MDTKFLGRDDFVRSLVDALREGSVLLEGARGIGKSQVLKHLDAHPPPGFVVLRFDLQGVQSAEQLAQRMEQHVHLRRTRIEDLFSTMLGDWRRGDPWDSLESLLAQRAPHGCLVLLDEVQLYVDQLARRDADRARADLERLLQLRVHPSARLLLTGSISLRPVAKQVGVTVSPDWRRIQLGPLARADGATLFDARCSGACSDEAALEGHRLAGGYPRWIERVAQRIVAPPDRCVSVDDLQVAVSRLLDGDPFSGDMSHLARHGAPARFQHALELAARPDANQLSVMAGLQRRGMSRGEAGDLLATLRDEFYLDDGCGFTLPLFGEWLRRRA